MARFPLYLTQQENYQILMDTFPEKSLGSNTFENLSTHHLKQVPVTVISIGCNSIRNSER